MSHPASNSPEHLFNRARAILEEPAMESQRSAIEDLHHLSGFYCSLRGE